MHYTKTFSSVNLSRNPSHANGQLNSRLPNSFRKHGCIAKMCLITLIMGYYEALYQLLEEMTSVP